MTIQLVVYTLITSALLALGAMLAHTILRSAIPGTRFVWAAALGASLALLALAPARTRAPEVSAPEVTYAPATSPSVGLDATPTVAARSLGVRLAEVLPTWSGGAFGTLWALGAVALLGLIVITYQAHRRRVRMAARVIVDGTTVHVTDSFGPAVVGAWPGEIVVPRWLLDRPHDEQALVVRHERAHIDAGDPSLLLGGCAIVALMPWNPFAWYLLARLRLAIEVDCDRRVLRAGAGPREYGALLIELTANSPATRAGAPAFACRTSHLERRIRAMTARPLTHRRARFAAAVGVAALAFTAACEADLPTASQVEQMNAASVEEVVIPKLGIDPAQVEYVLDGVIVDRSVVSALQPGEIESIEVVRADAPRMLVSTKKDAEIPVTPLQFRDVKLPYAKEVEVPGGKPLFVIDGVIAGNIELRQLDPARIETVDVVKGEAAKRIYGERAAYGVILVKTWPDGARRPLLRENVRGTLSSSDSSATALVLRRDAAEPSARRPDR